PARWCVVRIVARCSSTIDFGSRTVARDVAAYEDQSFEVGATRRDDWLWLHVRSFSQEFDCNSSDWLSRRIHAWPLESRARDRAWQVRACGGACVDGLDVDRCD